MPRSKEGVKRAKIDLTDLNAAVAAVVDESNPISLREACDVYSKEGKSFSLKTLHRHVQKFKQSGVEKFDYKNKCDWRRVFTDTEEKLLVNYCITISHMKYGLSRKELCELAWKYAKAKNKDTPESWGENERAGEQWVKDFMKRHKELSVRKPEATSLSRATSFNRTNVNKFFENLTTVMDRYGPISGSDIYNVDETAVPTVTEPSKIIAPKGQKQVGFVTSAERGQLITMIGGASAIGNHIPPYFVFPRTNFKDFMLTGAPPGSDGTANPTGWSNHHILVKYMHHFIKYVKPSTEKRVLLIFDNHKSHMSVEVIELAKANGIILLTLPPHTSGRMQPLDVSVYGPFKTYYTQEMQLWYRNNPGKTFSIYNVAAAVGQAFPQAFCPQNITSSFLNSGIYPLNPKIFKDHDFLSSYVTDRPLPTVPSQDSQLPSYSSLEDETSTTSKHTMAKESQNWNENMDLTPDFVQRVPNQNESASLTLEGVVPNQNEIAGLTTEDVVPYPKAAPRKPTNRGRKPGSTKILTLTPDKLNTSEMLSKAESLIEAKKQNLVKKFNQPKQNPASRKRLSFQESVDSSSSASSSYSTQDTSDGMESFSSDENLSFPKPDAVDEAKLQKGAYVIVRLLYEIRGDKTEPKYFIARIVKVKKSKIECAFLRKKVNSFYFRGLGRDVMDVDRDQIMAEVPLVNEKRGYYTFKTPWAQYCE